MSVQHNAKYKITAFGIAIFMLQLFIPCG